MFVDLFIFYLMPMGDRLETEVQELREESQKRSEELRRCVFVII